MTPTDQQYRDAARREYDDIGRIEIDEEAYVSRGDAEGAYVQAWLWVDHDHIATEEDGVL